MALQLSQVEAISVLRRGSESAEVRLPKKQPFREGLPSIMSSGRREGWSSGIAGRRGEESRVKKLGRCPYLTFQVRLLRKRKQGASEQHDLRGVKEGLTKSMMPSSWRES